MNYELGKTIEPYAQYRQRYNVASPVRFQEKELKRQGNDALIRITDNGTGIPDHMKDKVFTPNFTTKSSGTGLGLAISANMIESFNGRIYFETRVGSGTDFFVSIPLMRLDDYFGDENRVSLD